jgi:glutathionylspermidine synthase
MRRHTLPPRSEWRRRVEAQGLVFHSPGQGGTYWGEGTFYELSACEVELLEKATNEIQRLCLAAAEHVIAERRFAQLGIPQEAIPLVERAWELDPPSIYGRLDLALGQDGVPKLLEYNADTPTSLLEAAVIQWSWLGDCFPRNDQLNSIHERLIAGWQSLRPHLAGGMVHFATVDNVEDEMTVGYLRDTAEQAGLASVGLRMAEVGWDRRTAALVDLEGRRIRNLFKLYPWEGLLADPFAPLLPRAELAWIEPAWKMLLSSKGILPVLWELFPDHPNLLPAFFERGKLAAGVVQKPLHGREGANVRIEAPGISVATDGPYGAEGFVYQAYSDLGEHDGRRPVIGSWIVAGEAAGVGIRETEGFVTDDRATFVPHLIG